MSRELSTRFLNAFIQIEQRLKAICGVERYQPFYHLVNDAARKDPFVRDAATELKEYGDLRNAIVHERIDDEPIAEPHRKVVERLEKIRDLLQKPPTVNEAFLGAVITCSSRESIAQAAQTMHKHSFSKIPVYDHDQFLGLLTAESICHWFGDQLGQNGESLAEQPAAAVLNYGAASEDYEFVAVNCPLFHVLELFDEYSHQGHRLQAVLITKDGEPHQDLLGIITVFDLPLIYRLLDRS